MSFCRPASLLNRYRSMRICASFAPRWTAKSRRHLATLISYRRPTPARNDSSACRTTPPTTSAPSPRNPEGCQTVAGGRNAVETPGSRSENSPRPRRRSQTSGIPPGRKRFPNPLPGSSLRCNPRPPSANRPRWVGKGKSFLPLDWSLKPSRRPAAAPKLRSGLGKRPSTMPAEKERRESIARIPSSIPPPRRRPKPR